MAAKYDEALSEPCLHDFAQRCRRLAAWEPNPRLRSLLLKRAGEYDRLAQRLRSPFRPARSGRI
jgi:hypothetical protein